MEKQLRYKKGPIEIIIPFENDENLKKELDSLKNTLKIVDEQISDIGIQRTPKPGYEDLYRYNEDGLIELLKIPPTKLDTIILVMFFQHPTPITTESLVAATGIPTSPQYVGNKKKYGELFSDAGRGQYALQQKALDLAVNKIVPELRKQDKSSEPNNNSKGE